MFVPEEMAEDGEKQQASLWWNPHGMHLFNLTQVLGWQ